MGGNEVFSVWGGWGLCDCLEFAAAVVFFATENWMRERKVLCSGRGAVFEIGTLLRFVSLLERLRGGRLLFPLRRKK
jgi:hypothetical protein